MDAKELRKFLTDFERNRREAGALTALASTLTKPGSDQPFYDWWYCIHLTKDEQKSIYPARKDESTSIPYFMLELSDEELMFLWAVYLM
jgi:hypothetical protein